MNICFRFLVHDGVSKGRGMGCTHENRFVIKEIGAKRDLYSLDDEI